MNRKSILYLILLAIASAVFIGFSDIFQTRQVSQISFYMIYLLVMGICLASFQAASEWMANGVHTLTGFMKVLYPVYFAAVTVAKGSISSLAFYHLAIILIVVIEELLLHLIVPGIHMYVIIRVMNSLQSEDYLSKFAELLETAIGWGLKTLMGGMIGLNVRQGMLGPAIDNCETKRSDKRNGDGSGGRRSAWRYGRGCPWHRCADKKQYRYRWNVPVSCTLPCTIIAACSDHTWVQACSSTGSACIG